MKIKKIIILFITVLVISNIHTQAAKLLKTFIAEARWEELPNIFIDESYKMLISYFSDCQSIKIITSNKNNLTYKAKFSSQGEIGVITFDYLEQKGLYGNLKIQNQIQPLYFIEKFKKYKVSNMNIGIGDAKIQFESGYFYETFPFQSLILFEGKWNFYIKPTDKEEQLTLERIYKKEYFSQTNNCGIFILPEKDFLKKMTLIGEVKSLEKDSDSLFKLYRNAFGIHIKQYDEYWYLPFPQGTHFVAFKKDADSFYYYTFNSSIAPDTRLLDSESNNMILNYNVNKGVKLRIGGNSNISKMNLNIFFNPLSNFISGTSILKYKEPTSLKTVELAEGIKITGNLDLEAKGLNIFRKRETYYLLGADNDSLSLYFRGKINPKTENFELFKIMGENGPAGKVDKEEKPELFYFLYRTDNFYPNPGNEFFETHTTVTVPNQLNCLASGNLIEQVDGEPSIFKFQSVNSKGIALAVGDFVPSGKMESGESIQFYTPKNYPLPKDVNLHEIHEGYEFFSQYFNSLDLNHINILLRPGDQEGGISNNGFIVVNYFSKKKRIALANRKVLSPIRFRDTLEDYILHELAHQWWGGVISWDSYRDIWITEGLAQFSVLYFLKKKLPEKQFSRILKRLKRWVYRYSNSGPIIYGTRIRSLENRIEPYQSVVYNKTALVFFMAMELMGEEEFNHKLKSVLTEFKYKSVSSMRFINSFCKGDERLLNFFKKWIFSRTLPEVELVVVRDDPDFDTENFQTVVISLKQLGTDFIFPLKLKVSSQKNTSIKNIIVDGPEQKIVFKDNSPIRAVDIEDWVTPIKEKKNLLPPSK